MVPKPDVTAPKRRRSRVIRKRRQTFERLALAAGSTLVIGLIPGLRWFLLLHVIVDVALGVYVGRLLQWKREEQGEALPAAAPPVPAPPRAPVEDPGVEDDTAPHRAYQG